METPLVLIDGSYFIFYRVYSLINWWKKARPESSVENLDQNEEFLDKFKEIVVKKIKEIPKKLKLKNCTLWFAKDCPRKSIWRNKYFDLKSQQIQMIPEFNELKEQPNSNSNDFYKAGRKQTINISPFFKIAYSENLLQQAGIKKILYHPNLEADDCVALTTKHFNKETIIIANDHDYKQLLNDHCKLYNLQYKEITSNNPPLDLFLKIILGDKSDNIKGLFKRCGKKTGEKYFNDRELFNKKCKEEQQLIAFEINKILIDFNYIPSLLQKEFIEQLKKIE